MSRPKNQPVKPAGRPPLPEMSERQAVMRRELLNVVKPYFKSAVAQIALIAGIVNEVPADKEVLTIENEDVKTKKEIVSAATKLTACKIIVDTYKDSLKEVYLKEDTTPAEKEPEPIPQSTGKVSRLSLTVQNPQV